MDDLHLARLLQEQFDREAATQLADRENVDIGKSKRTKENDNKNQENHLNQLLSPVDPSLELSDPNPNILTMFLEFNERFFWGRLSSIEVKWSPRMTLCAGLCVYEGKGGLCSVRLSTPLLKLRPRKDLVETLLHEMIHAYLFITDNDRDHDGHGPNFKNHMNRINLATGANISIYHNFHDEVESYQQHWWRCNGPCQNRKPYYGYVKRAMNREPSAHDRWWQEHQMTCGGTFTKIREPESYTKKKQEKEAKNKNKSLDIRAFVGKGNMLSDKAWKGGDAGTDKLKAPVAARGAQNGFVVNGVLIRKGASSSSPLFSTSGGGALLKTASDVVDLTVASYDDFETGDDTWMLEADSSDNAHTVGRPASNTDLENPKLRLIDTNNERFNESVCNRIQDQDPKIPTQEFQPDKFGLGHIDLETNRPKKRKGLNGFVSVCEPVDSLPGPKEQSKFVFSDSDSDSDLWGDDSKETSHAVKTIEPKDSISSSAPARQELSEHNLHVSASVGANKTKTPGWSIKDSSKDKQMQGQNNELNSQNEGSKYTGQGYKLGSAEQGTSFLSIVRKTFDTVARNVSPSTVYKDALAVQPTYSSTENTNKKKSSEDLYPKAIKRQKFDVPKESAAIVGLDFAHDGPDQRASNKDSVPCPVCNKLVETSAINSHLDKCLL